MPTGAVLLASMTIPGRPDRLHDARAFVARVLGDCSCADTMILLISELVTNSLLHSRSCRDGGTITVTLIDVPGGIRAEVIDEGGATVPALHADQGQPPELAENGRGLKLVDMLSARWSYWRDEAGTVTWFELTEPPRE